MEPTQEKDGVVRHTVQGVVRRLELLEARVRDLEAAASCPTGSGGSGRHEQAVGW